MLYGAHSTPSFEGFFGRWVTTFSNHAPVHGSFQSVKLSMQVERGVSPPLTQVGWILIPI